MTSISILIPAYNCYCAPLVQKLQHQASGLPDLCYEIIVADDGSQDADISNDLQGFSSLLSTASRLERLRMKWVVQVFHTLFSPLEKSNLLSSHPSLFVFKLYKLGYFVSL